MPQDYDEDMRRSPHVDEDLVPFDVKDYSNRRAMRILFIVMAAILVSAIILVNMYYAGTRGRGEAPRIEADGTPFKVQPENPGGEVVPNQDKTVYDVMNGTANESETVTIQETEEPIDLPSSVPVEVEDTPVVTPKPTQPDVKPAPTGAGSNYVAQIASVRSSQDADEIWDKISSNYPALLPSGAYPDIKRVNLEGRGVFYRLRIAGLRDKEAASKLCSALEAQKQACFVTTK